MKTNVILTSKSLKFLPLLHSVETHCCIIPGILVYVDPGMKNLEIPVSAVLLVLFSSEAGIKCLLRGFRTGCGAYYAASLSCAEVKNICIKLYYHTRVHLRGLLLYRGTNLILLHP